MSGVAGPVTQPVTRPARRVRHDVRDGLVVMAFSASASTALATVLTLLAGLGK